MLHTCFVELLKGQISKHVCNIYYFILTFEAKLFYAREISATVQRVRIIIIKVEDFATRNQQFSKLSPLFFKNQKWLHYLFKSALSKVHTRFFWKTLISNHVIFIMMRYQMFIAPFWTTLILQTQEKLLKCFCNKKWPI